MDDVYDQALADRAVKFIRLLKHSKGRWAGSPFNLLPWQENEIIRPLFGTVNDDGSRQYRTAYISFGRKNGKSEIGAAIALYLLFADGEYGAEIYSAAADRDQASIVFNVAASMVRQLPALEKRCRIIDSQKRIIIPQTESVYRVLSSDAHTKHGFNPSGVIFDELHAQPNRDLWDVLTTGSGTRRQPLVVALTTAGYDRNSICWEQYKYASDIKKGHFTDPTFFSCVYEVPEDADWKDEKNWSLGNPGLGAFLNIDEMRAAAKKAENIPALQNTFRRLRLNQWTQQETRWIPLDKWDQGGEPFDFSLLKNRPCYGGLDLSSTTDISAFLLVFPPTEEDPFWRVHATFWIPEEKMRERSQRDKVPYETWHRQGLIESTPGNVVDYAYIRARINRLGGEFGVSEIGFDPWNATQLSLDLAADGFTMVPIRQGFASLSPPSKELERIVNGGIFRHGGNPILRWMADNVMVIQDPAGNIKPDKSKSTERIDGIVALIMALDRATRQQIQTSVYEERGVITL